MFHDTKVLSVIIPFHNEAENLPVFLVELLQILNDLHPTYEVVLVDDGSTDHSHHSIRHFVDTLKIKLVCLGRQMGKGKALNAGLRTATGDIICFMDADMQDDPADLVSFISKINDGYDLVNGHRHDRKDSFLIRTYSAIAGKVLKTYLKSPFSDVNCGFKMFRRDVLEKVTIYGNNFRFFPIAAYYEGFLVTEVPVHNRPRLHGKTKYGPGKLPIGLLDMLSAYFLYRFADRPLHFFGSLGAVSFLLGGSVLLYITYERIFLGMLLYRRPALQYAIFFVILGIQVIMTGILGELIVYMHRSKHKS